MRIVEGLDRITFDPQVMGGKPCIRGMRVTVGMIVRAIASGLSPDELLAYYPYLEREDIKQPWSMLPAVLRKSKNLIWFQHNYASSN